MRKYAGADYELALRVLAPPIPNVPLGLLYSIETGERQQPRSALRRFGALVWLADEEPPRRIRRFVRVLWIALTLAFLWLLWRGSL